MTFGTCVMDMIIVLTHFQDACTKFKHFWKLDMQDNLIDTLAFLLNGTYEKYVNCHEHIKLSLNTKTIQSTVIVFISITFKNFISREVGKNLMPI